jgi:two-component system cell cycle response regulator DivK
MKDTTVPDASPLVLIVDDNARNLKLARDVLLAVGFRTLEAVTGAEGIVLAGERLPDVILMDLRLPDMDGTVAARKLANEARTSAIPVVAFSSLALQENAAWLRDAGFVGQIQKPIDILAFPDQVRSYCSEHGPPAPG